MSRLDAIDTGSLLDDFIGEARAHIEKIESAFLDVGALTGDPALMDGVFRAAHSLKGTAGFFSLEKIVAVAHELESVFSRIKAGELSPDGEIADAALRSVDCLRDLLDHLHTPDAVDADSLLALLRGLSRQRKPKAPWAQMPFDLADPAVRKALESAERRGQSAYYLKIRFGGGLGRYDSHPEGIVEDISSVGAIVRAALDGTEIEVSADPAERVTEALGARRVGELDLLVTSVLEPELFLIAVEVDGRCVYPLPEGFSNEGAKAGRAGEAGKADEKPAPAAPPSAERVGFAIQLDVAVVNGLMDLANEMILTRNRLFSFLSDYRKSVAGLAPVLLEMDSLTSEIQEKVMRARMQPIDLIFKKFPRIIRDTAKALGKEIQITISGGDVALDKYLLDSLSDPITQLVKNAADHGIESAERRAAAGKPLKGSIILSARLRDGSAVVEVSDDGAGMDPEVLRRKALERGLAAEERLAAMSGPALFSLIFEPGFTTAERVTSVSGRGVGMDIVKTNIEKLGGSVEVESEPGRGTTMRLRAPLSLSVIRTLVVTIGGVPHAVPEANVERIVRVSGATGKTDKADKRALKRLERLGSSLSLNLDGWLLPVVTLDEIDARARGTEPPAPETALARGVTKCLVLKAAEAYFALLIDDAVKTEETLIKPLPVYLRGCRCYSSTTVLGSGQAIMILDPEGILRFMKMAGAAKRAGGEAGAPEGDVRRAVVFQCSGPEYFALDTAEITRIERIDRTQIQEIDDRHYVVVAGKTLRVLRPEGYVPVQRRPYERGKLCLLVLAGTQAPPVGLLAARVLDQVEAAFTIDGDLLESRYILGTSAYREKILIFLNAAEIVKNIDLGFRPKSRKGA